MIQIITNNLQEYKGVKKGIVVSDFNSPTSPDEFEICILDLTNESLWRNTGKDYSEIGYSKDLRSIKEMIENSGRCNFVVVLPENLRFLYDYGANAEGKKGYRYYIELKNMSTELVRLLRENVYGSELFQLKYENTKTVIGGNSYTAAFYFDEYSSDKVLTKSYRGEKPTTLSVGSLYFTTLNVLKNENELLSYLSHIGVLYNHKQATPAWMGSVSKFNDESLYKEKKDLEQKVEDLKKSISDVQTALDENNKLKSILYTDGNELVEIVHEIFGEMVGYDFSSFVHEKREDFNAEIEGVTLIGEVKGVISNVKNANISKVDFHVQDYLDKANVGIDKVKGLLIINHQRSKPLGERESIHESQEKLATRNRCLIIETTTLVTLFEKYKTKQLSRQDILSMLIEESGVLKLK